MAATPAQRDAAQKLYEVDGLSYKKTAEAVGVSEPSIIKWKKKYGWAEKGSKRETPPEGTVQIGDDVPVVVPTEPEPPTEAPPPDWETEVEMLRRQLEAANALVAEVRPEVEKPVLTEDNFDDLVPDAELTAEAEAEFAAQNRQRVKAGLPALNRDTAAYQHELDQMKAQKRLERLSAPTDHVPVDLSGMVASRTIKMLHPRSGLEVQVMYEPQSNTRTGDLKEIAHLFRDKGYRLVIPQRCLLYDCSAPAATTGGEFANKGFCHGRGHQLPFEPGGGTITGTEGRIDPGVTDVLVGSSHGR